MRRDRRIQRPVKLLESLRGDGRDQSLLIRKVGVRRCMTHPRLARHLSQGQPTDAFLGKDRDPGIDQAVFEVTVMIVFLRNGGISPSRKLKGFPKTVRFMIHLAY